MRSNYGTIFHFAIYDSLLKLQWRLTAELQWHDPINLQMMWLTSTLGNITPSRLFDMAKLGVIEAFISVAIIDSIVILKWTS